MNPEKQKRLEWILDVLSLAAVLQYAAYRFLQSTQFTFCYTDTYKKLTMGLLLVFGGIRYLYVLHVKLIEKNRQEKRKFFLHCGMIWCLALPFFYVGFKYDYKFLIFLPFCCMALYEMEAKKVLTAFSFTIGVLLAATILCCLSNTVRNLVKTSENGRIAAAYGIVNTTDFASYFTFLLLTVWCGMQKKGWYAGILFAIAAGGISYLVYFYTNSRTVISCGVLIILFSLWDVFNENILQNKNNLLRIGNDLNRISLFAFPLICVIVIVLTVFYARQAPWAVQLDDALTGRLDATLLPYQTYGIHPFGSLIEHMNGKGGTLLSSGWSTGYGYIDVAYAMLAIRYGWIITAIVTGLWVWMTAKALRSGNSRIALAMAILAFHAFSEARVWDINYNIFLVMPFCALYPSTDNQNICDEKKSQWMPAVSALVILGAFLIVLPRILSCFRTFFSFKGWNHGTEVFNSLLVCLLIVILLWLLWFSLNRLIRDQSKKTILLLVAVIILGTVGTLLINGEINRQLNAQAERLDAEESIIRRIQDASVQPIYAAEPEELYRRRFAGLVTDHYFSTEELGRVQEGTILTDSDVETLGITMKGGVYTQISDFTGIYTYDPVVMRTLASADYEWTPYYSGIHYVDLSDTATFNNVISVKELEGPVRIITSNAETDQPGGKYTVSFSLSGFSGEENGKPLVTLKVLGESGERQILQETLYASDFDSNGQCNSLIEYVIESTPKVSYAVIVPEGIHLTIDEISWQRLLKDRSSGVITQADGKIIMTTDVPDNRFSLIHFQLYNATTGQYILDFGSGETTENIVGDYFHNSPSGLYYVRLKGNTNLADEWIQTLMYIEEGTILHYNYNIDEFTERKIVVSNVKIDKFE